MVSLDTRWLPYVFIPDTDLGYTWGPSATLFKYGLKSSALKNGLGLLLGSLLPSIPIVRNPSPLTQKKTKQGKARKSQWLWRIMWLTWTWYSPVAVATPLSGALYHEKHVSVYGVHGIHCSEVPMLGLGQTGALWEEDRFLKFDAHEWHFFIECM